MPPFKTATTFTPAKAVQPRFFHTVVDLTESDDEENDKDDVNNDITSHLSGNNDRRTRQSALKNATNDGDRRSLASTGRETPKPSTPRRSSSFFRATPLIDAAHVSATSPTKRQQSTGKRLFSTSSDACTSGNTSRKYQWPPYDPNKVLATDKERCYNCKQISPLSTLCKAPPLEDRARESVLSDVSAGLFPNPVPIRSHDAEAIDELLSSEFTYTELLEFSDDAWKQLEVLSCDCHVCQHPPAANTCSRAEANSELGTALIVGSSIKKHHNKSGCKHDAACCQKTCQNNKCIFCPKAGYNLTAPNEDGSIVPSTSDDQPLVFECGLDCSCYPHCKRSVVLNGPNRSLNLELHNADLLGWSLRTVDAIPAHTFLFEYCGRVITRREARLLGMLPQPITNYVFDNGDLSIDAGEQGNVARWINHSCRPNCTVMCSYIGHTYVEVSRLIIVTKREIRPGEPLSIDYGPSWWKLQYKASGLTCACFLEECKFTHEKLEKLSRIVSEGETTPESGREEEGRSKKFADKDFVVSAGRGSSSRAGTDADCNSNKNRKSYYLRKHERALRQGSLLRRRETLAAIEQQKRRNVIGGGSASSPGGLAHASNIQLNGDGLRRRGRPMKKNVLKKNKMPRRMLDPDEIFHCHAKPKLPNEVALKQRRLALASAAGNVLNTSPPSSSSATVKSRKILLNQNNTAAVRRRRRRSSSESPAATTVHEVQQRILARRQKQQQNADLASVKVENDNLISFDDLFSSVSPASVPHGDDDGSSSSDSDGTLTVSSSSEIENVDGGTKRRRRRVRRKKISIATGEKIVKKNKKKKLKAPAASALQQQEPTFVNNLDGLRSLVHCLAEKKQQNESRAASSSRNENTHQRPVSSSSASAAVKTEERNSTSRMDQDGFCFSVPTTSSADNSPIKAVPPHNNRSNNKIHYAVDAMLDKNTHDTHRASKKSSRRMPKMSLLRDELFGEMSTSCSRVSSPMSMRSVDNVDNGANIDSQLASSSSSCLNPSEAHNSGSLPHFLTVPENDAPPLQQCNSLQTASSTGTSSLFSAAAIAADVCMQYFRAPFLPPVAAANMTLQPNQIPCFGSSSASSSLFMQRQPVFGQRATTLNLAVPIPPPQRPLVHAPAVVQSVQIMPLHAQPASGFNNNNFENVAVPEIGREEFVTSTYPAEPKSVDSEEAEEDVLSHQQLENQQPQQQQHQQPSEATAEAAFAAEVIISSPSCVVHQEEGANTAMASVATSPVRPTSSSSRKISFTSDDGDNDVSNAFASTSNSSSSSNDLTPTGNNKRIRLDADDEDDHDGFSPPSSVNTRKRAPTPVNSSCTVAVKNSASVADLATRPPSPLAIAIETENDDDDIFYVADPTRSTATAATSPVVLFTSDNIREASVDIIENVEHQQSDGATVVVCATTNVVASKAVVADVIDDDDVVVLSQGQSPTVSAMTAAAAAAAVQPSPPAAVKKATTTFVGGAVTESLNQIQEMSAVIIAAQQQASASSTSGGPLDLSKSSSAASPAAPMSPPAAASSSAPQLQQQQLSQQSLIAAALHRLNNSNKGNNVPSRYVATFCADSFFAQLSPRQLLSFGNAAAAAGAPASKVCGGVSPNRHKLLLVCDGQVRNCRLDSAITFDRLVRQHKFILSRTVIVLGESVQCRAGAHCHINMNADDEQQKGEWSDVNFSYCYNCYRCRAPHHVACYAATRKQADSLIDLVRKYWREKNTNGLMELQLECATCANAENSGGRNAADAAATAARNDADDDDSGGDGGVRLIVSAKRRIPNKNQRKSSSSSSTSSSVVLSSPAAPVPSTVVAASVNAGGTNKRIIQDDSSV